MTTPYVRDSKVRACAMAALANEYISRYRGRIVRGLAVYGEFNPATDTRCLSQEAIEECLDIGSYLEFLELKDNRLTGRIQKIRAKTILLYGELKKLEEAERGV